MVKTSVIISSEQLTPDTTHWHRVPPNNLVLVQVNAVVHVLAGVLLALGRLPRVAALSLAASLVPTTLGGHAFWRLDDPTRRTPQQVNFDKNLAIIGGLLFLVLEDSSRNRR